MNDLHPSCGWNEPRTELLMKLWQDGKSASEISKTLGGVSRNAVIGKVHRLGLSGRATPSKPARTVFNPPRRVRAPAVPRDPHAASGLNMKGAQSGKTAVIFAGPGAAVGGEPKPPHHGRAGAFAPLPGVTPVPFGSPGCRWPLDGFAEPMACGASRGCSGPYCRPHSRLSASRWQPDPQAEVEPLKWKLPR